MMGLPGKARQILAVGLLMCVAVTSTPVPATAGTHEADIAMKATVGNGSATRSAVPGPPVAPASEGPVVIDWEGSIDSFIYKDEYDQNGTLYPRPRPTLPTLGPALAGKPITQFEDSYFTKCALAQGKVYCWGANESGQLGNGTTTAVPQADAAAVGGLLADKTVSAIVMDTSYVCALADFQVYCWGTGNVVRPAAPTVPSTVPLVVDGFRGLKVSAISTHRQTACAIAAGRVFCWGKDIGQDLDQSSYPVPTEMQNGGWGGEPVTSVSVGPQAACIIAGGHAYCWGMTVTKEEPYWPSVRIRNPTRVQADAAFNKLTVKAISANEFHTCAIAGRFTDRNVYCWGQTHMVGRLHDTPPESITPRPVDTSGVLKGKSATLIGSRCVIANDGRPYCWGEASGNYADKVLPHAVDVSGPMADRRVLAMSFVLSRSGVAVRPRVFTDVPTSYPFYDDIVWAAGTGITQGFDASTFRPTSVIDRQAMSAFVFRALNPGVPDPKCDPAAKRLWSDVGVSNPFCGTIEWLKAQGFATGSLFRPAAATTRATMAKMIFRAHHPGMPDRVCSAASARLFSDVTRTTDSCGDIEWLATTGIATGYSSGTYQPGQAVTRDAMTAFLHRRNTLAKAG
ncbi:hypothetical protein D1871_07745 [Nakamurella silvestris]|nr:hypothetical protein D1871_07745 [Nakamurella silvestris]